MKALLILAVVTTIALPAHAADLDALIQDYQKIKSGSGRGGGRGGFGGGRRGFGGGDQWETARRARPILEDIAKLATNRAMKFLHDEIGRAQHPFAYECARAIASSGSERALKSLFAYFGRKPPRGALAVLDALDPQPRENRGGGPAGGRGGFGGRGGRGGFGGRGGPSPNDRITVDWSAISKELLGAARVEQDVALRTGLVSCLEKLESVDGAKGVLHCAAVHRGVDEPIQDLLEKSGAALETLGKKSDEVRAWLEDDAFDYARSNPGMLAAALNAAGRLELGTARERVEKLVSHRSELVVTAALRALNGMGGDLTVASIRAIRNLIKKKISDGTRIELLDQLARNGGKEALDVVIDSARNGKDDVRAIAMGSLALAADQERAVDAILAGLRDMSSAVRANAIRALTSVRAKSMIPALIDYLDSEETERLRVDALKILVRATGYNMGLVVADWRKWWDGARDEFEFPTGDQTTTVVRARELSYFGIDIASDRIAFVIDVSLSMREVGGGFGGPGGFGGRRGGREGDGKPKIDVMKDELVRVLEKLSKTARINILPFDGDVQQWKKKLHPLAGGGLREAIRYVRSLGMDYHTNVFDSVELALQDTAVDTVYLLTDGEPTTGKFVRDADIIRGVRDLNRTRGVTIHCIAFGEQSELLREIARQNGGEYRFVSGREGDTGDDGGERSRQLVRGDGGGS